MSHEFDTILDSASLLKDNKSIVFLFVGSGKRLEHVVQGVKSRGLGNVHFREPVSLNELSSLLASARVHLISLRQGLEGMVVPSKVYGAMAAGRPAILVGSMRNEAAQLLTESGAGLVVPNGRAGALVEAIRGLEKDTNQGARMGEAGRLYYEQHLGLDRSVKGIVDVLTCARPRPRT
jgi:glycosyltransferase involved in cell wall biosynthesis